MTQMAIDRGLLYLKKNQKDSGTFAGTEGFRVAIDALGGLAFLAGGHTDSEGPHTEVLRRVISNLLSAQNDRGYFDDGQSRMYGHGFATLFLAELYGMTGDQGQTIRNALKLAVKLIEDSQCDDGGWDYQPDASRGSDTSITVCQTMALRAARNLGIHIQLSVVERRLRDLEQPAGTTRSLPFGRRRSPLAKRAFLPARRRGMALVPEWTRGLSR